MGLQGTTQIKGVQMTAYFKLSIDRVDEGVEPIYDEKETTKVIGERKIFILRYGYFVKGSALDKNAILKFEDACEDVNIDQNLYKQGYAHLANKLSVDSTEV